MATRLLRVAHVLPSLALGGAEVGVWKSRQYLQSVFDYRVYHVLSVPIQIDCGQRHVKTLLRDILTRKWRPDIVVTSLSWAHPIGQLCKLLGIPWISFFHSAGFSNGRDKFAQRWAWMWSDYRLVDSAATYASMSSYGSQECSIIPYRFSHQEGSIEWLSREFDVIWVGRNHPDKRLDLFPTLCTELMQRTPLGRIAVVVAGEVPDYLMRLSMKNGWNLALYQNIDNDLVCKLLGNSRFYVLLSDYEGMSMSTVEAVAAGCVPIVRPVGEIPLYVHADNGIWIEDISTLGLANVAQKMIGFWKNERVALPMIEAGKLIVDQFPDYLTSFERAIRKYSARALS